MSVAVCNYHTDQCTMCKYGGIKLSLIAEQHMTIKINRDNFSFPAVYADLYSRLMHTNSTHGILENF